MKIGLTFSSPQNLSLPFSRKGPGGASIRYLSRGVIWRALGSFFEGDKPFDGLEAPCEPQGRQPLVLDSARWGLLLSATAGCSTRLCSAVWDRVDRQGVLTALDRIRLKKDDILCMLS